MALYDARAEMEKLNARIMELTAENESYKACVSHKLCRHLGEALQHVFHDNVNIFI